MARDAFCQEWDWIDDSRFGCNLQPGPHEHHYYGRPLCLQYEEVNGQRLYCKLMLKHPSDVHEHRLPQISYAPEDNYSGAFETAGVDATAAEDKVARVAEHLAAWWRAKAESEIDQTVAKAIEYSGTGGGLPLDLVNQGREWVLASNRNPGDYTDAQLAEVGVWDYMVGKLGRWSSALRNGRMVSDDTLLDLAVYSRMCVKIRETGVWP